MKITGKAITFGENVNTDVIIPGQYLTNLDPQILAAHAMEGMDPSFPEKAAKGVIIVAGKNFGCGSSREQAPVALKYAGVKCIVASSFARIFYRNSINIGLPVLECPNIFGRVETGNELAVNLSKGTLVNLSKNESFEGVKLPPFLLDILTRGGLIEHLKKRFGNELI